MSVSRNWYMIEVLMTVLIRIRFVWRHQYLCDDIGICVTTSVFVWRHQYLCDNISICVTTSVFVWRHQHLCDDISNCVTTSVFVWRFDVTIDRGLWRIILLADWTSESVDVGLVNLHVVEIVKAGSALTTPGIGSIKITILYRHRLQQFIEFFTDLC